VTERAQRGDFDLTGRVAFVTGAADGLGFAYAEALAEHGARVVLTDVDEAKLSARREELAARGLAVEAEVLDVADLARVRATIDEVAARHRRVDAVFANAGISAGPGPALPGGAIADVTLESWERVLRINLTSVFITMQAAAEHMKRQRRGRIVATSSIGGMKSEPLVGYAYAATKAAVNTLVRHAAVELAPFNVLVNAIAPGPFRTNIAGGRLRTNPEIEQRFAEEIPLGRIAEPSEIQGLAVFLASDASSYLTGAVIPIDGGATAW
jgi:NAD(P)-dependent dehydrogenase (short-subunit alcohol dehydrogenase family)